jgi:hypothetical protein
MHAMQTPHLFRSPLSYSHWFSIYGLDFMVKWLLCIRKLLLSEGKMSSYLESTAGAGAGAHCH